MHGAAGQDDLAPLEGAMLAGGDGLDTGDAAAFTPSEDVALACTEASEVLLFDLA